MVSKTFAIDAATGLIKRALGSAALTSDAYVGTQHDQGAAVITDMLCRIVIEAVDVAGGDERYAFRIIGSNVADRSDGQILAMMEVGDAAAVPIETVDAAAGQVVDIRFRTERDNTAFRYIDLHLDGTGASFSITFGAYITKEIC